MTDHARTQEDLLAEISLLKQRLQELEQPKTNHSPIEKGLRASEKALAHKTMLLEAQSETAIDGILAVDADGHVILSNRRFGEIWSIPQHIVESGNDQEMLKYAFRQLKDPEEFGGQVAELYERRESKSRDEIALLDGRYLDRYSAPMVDADGKYLGRIWFFRDITVRKQAEEGLQRMNAFLDSILENIPDMIFIKDAKALRFVRFNRAGEDLLGYSREEMIGKNDYDFFPPEQADSFTAKDREVLSGKVVVDLPEEPLQTRNKGVRTIHTKKVPILDAQGEPAYLLGISEDITERRSAEKELEQPRHRLEELVAKRAAALTAVNQELESFSYSVSHDLRAPLRAIDGFLRRFFLKTADRLNDDEKNLFEEIRGNTHKMSQLIDDLLAFSRMGHKTMTFCDIDMRELAEQVWKELLAINPHRRISLKIDDLPLAFGDRALIKQILTNLLSNSVKFTQKREEALIEMGGKTTDLENIYFVRDNGAGFDMNYYKKLFGVFQRLHSVEEFEGNGAGLAIVKRIIDRHGGQVWAESKVDEGAIFYFTIPARKNVTF